MFKYVITIVILYTFMSACLHLKMDADIVFLQLQTNADALIPHKIRLLQEMSACLQNIYYI